MTKLSYKERERLRREKEILHTAARIINERGYAQLNMDEVAEEVGVSKPTLYQHFKSKDEMVIYTMIESADKLLELIDSTEASAPLQRLELILRYLLKSHLETAEFPATMVHEESLTQQKAYIDMIKKRKIVGERLQSIVRQAQERGEIPPHIPSMVVISSMFGMLGILKGPQMMNDHSVEMQTIAEGIVHLFLHGVTAPGDPASDHL